MYRVQLENFEGPLDLLLFFIKRDELNIYDIPIAYITEQFLEYIHWMEELDLDVASEFIHMASMLMSIKAKMMLPHVESDDEEDIDERDPRYELVQRLLEYKRYKEMGEKMEQMDREARKSYSRGNTDIDKVEKQASGEALKDVTMYELMAAFKNVLSEAKQKEAVHTVEREDVTVEQQTEYILDKLHEEGKTRFIEICRDLKDRMKIVVTFLAILEMLKEHQINLYIGDDSSDFAIDLKPVDEILTE